MIFLLSCPISQFRNQTCFISHFMQILALYNMKLQSCSCICQIYVPQVYQVSTSTLFGTNSQALLALTLLCFIFFFSCCELNTVVSEWNELSSCIQGCDSVRQQYHFIQHLHLKLTLLLPCARPFWSFVGTQKLLKTQSSGMCLKNHAFSSHGVKAGALFIYFSWCCS